MLQALEQFLPTAKKVVGLTTIKGSTTKNTLSQRHIVQIQWKTSSDTLQSGQSQVSFYNSGDGAGFNGDITDAELPADKGGMK